MATKKSAGSTQLGRDSAAKRLGAKLHDGQYTKTGQIIFRQRGTKVHPGKNVGRGKDDTLYALNDGIVKYTRRKVNKFDGSLQLRTFANVVPGAAPVAKPKKIRTPKTTKAATKPKAKPRAKK